MNSNDRLIDASRKTVNNSVNDAVHEKNNIPNIEIIGDSHLNAINPKGLSKHNNVIVFFFFKDFSSREKIAHGLAAKFSQRHGKT